MRVFRLRNKTKKVGAILVIAIFLVSSFVATVSIGARPVKMESSLHPVTISVVRYGYRIRFDYFPDEVNEMYWQKGINIKTIVHPEEILYRTDKIFTWINICYVSAIRVELELTSKNEKYSNNTILIYGYVVFAKNSFKRILFAQHGTIAFFTNTDYSPIPDGGNFMSRFLFTFTRWYNPYNKAIARFIPFISRIWQMNGLDVEDEGNKTHIDGEYYNTITQEIVKPWIDISYNESGYHNETCGVRFL